MLRTIFTVNSSPKKQEYQIVSCHLFEDDAIIRVNFIEKLIEGRHVYQSQSYNQDDELSDPNKVSIWPCNSMDLFFEML